MPFQAFVRSALPLLLSVAGVSACVRDERQGSSEQRREVVSWEFPPDRTPALRLWPASASTPERLKREMSTENDHGRLLARVIGKDPYFVWRLANETAVRLVSFELEASRGGVVQLFWASGACPTFREACSSTEDVSAGHQWIDFLLDPTKPIRELRFDLPDEEGMVFWISEIALFERAEMSPRWKGSESGTTLALERDGLHLKASDNDPWMTIPTPGFDAASFDAVELVLRGAPADAPQLFWVGPCVHYDEACSVHLRGADAGPLTHRASLARIPTWRGPIKNLRIDPADSAGEYVVEHIAFSHTATTTSAR